MGIDTITNQQLKPQEGRQYEVGIKWQPRGVNALVTVAAFDIEISNLPNPNSLFGANSQQEGVSKVRGVEFEANALLGGLRLDAERAEGELGVDVERAQRPAALVDFGLAGLALRHV